MLDLCKKLWREDEGATAIEYGLICALIVTVIVASLSTVASRTTDMYNLLISTWANAVG